jgi:hypothetical protein
MTQEELARVRDADLRELKSRLWSLHQNDLADLLGGLAHMSAGSEPPASRPATEPMTGASPERAVQDLIGLFNATLTRVQAVLDCYETVRASSPQLPRTA